MRDLTRTALRAIRADRHVIIEPHGKAAGLTVGDEAPAVEAQASGGAPSRKDLGVEVSETV